MIETIAAIKAPISLTFVKENYKQLFFSEEELRKKKTGVPGKMFPAAWMNPKIKKADISSFDRDLFMQKEFSSTPVLSIVLCDPSRRAPASGGDFPGIISLGCVMENMWLMANSLGISFHIVSSLSNGPIEKSIKKLLNIPKNLIIAYSFRPVYAGKPYKYLRLRREVSDFTYDNKYGENIKEIL